MAKKNILTKKQEKEAKHLAEKLKKHKDISNPFALANWQVQQTKKKKKK